MNVLNIEQFYQFRFNPENKILDNHIINGILENFYGSESIKNKKIYPKKVIQTTILNVEKKQIIKDKIINKVNLILNKLSNLNINNLIIEFINNIKLLTQEDFNEFIIAVYYKILNEINFIKNYITFFKLISSIYIKVNNFNISYLYKLIENGFKLNYLENIDFEIINNLDTDEKRLNNLKIIKELININLLNSSITDEIDEIMINQEKHYSDIYYWFINNKLSDIQIEKINEIIQNSNCNNREKILLNTLINNNFNDTKKNKLIYKSEIKKITDKEEIIDKEEIKEIIEIEIKKDKTLTFNIELENLIDEYLELQIIEEIEYFLKENCDDANKKNNFCNIIINKYFILENEDDIKKILQLFKLLIKRQSLFKSNLSRGLLILNKSLSNNEIINNKLKKFLLFLKNIGITKGLEYLMSKFNIDLSF
jgi:hypothetical protein